MVLFAVKCSVKVIIIKSFNSSDGAIIQNGSHVNLAVGIHNVQDYRTPSNSARVGAYMDCATNLQPFPVFQFCIFKVRTNYKFGAWQSLGRIYGEDRGMALHQKN